MKPCSIQIQIAKERLWCELYDRYLLNDRLSQHAEKDLEDSAL